MRKITWILPIVSICLALLLGVGILFGFSPVLINVLSCEIERVSETNGIVYTWAQNDTAHDLLLWQAKHAVNPAYRAACLQYLVKAYYHPLSDWSHTHAETGETVYQSYLQTLERVAQNETRAENIAELIDDRYDLLFDTQAEYTDYGFLSPQNDLATYEYFAEPRLAYAAYVYLQIDKARGKEMYLDYVQNATDHFYCDEFLRTVSADKNADTDDLAWVKAQANAAADALSAEYQVFVDVQTECTALYNQLYNAGQVPRQNEAYRALYERAFNAMPHTNAEFEAKCKTLRNLASDTN